jgi:hypothetical protein
MFYGPEALINTNNEARFYRKLKHLVRSIIPKFYGIYHYKTLTENDDRLFSTILLEDCHDEGFNI